jgi:ribosomal protein L40E
MSQQEEFAFKSYNPPTCECGTKMVEGWDNRNPMWVCPKCGADKHRPKGGVRCRECGKLHLIGIDGNYIVTVCPNDCERRRWRWYSAIERDEVILCDNETCPPGWSDTATLAKDWVSDWLSGGFAEVCSCGKVTYDWEAGKGWRY